MLHQVVNPTERKTRGGGKIFARVFRYQSPHHQLIGLFHYGCSEHTAALLSGITYQGRNRGASGLMLDFILNYIESSKKTIRSKHKPPTYKCWEPAYQK